MPGRFFPFLLKNLIHPSLSFVLHSPLTLVVDKYQPHTLVASTFTSMGKSDEKQTKKMAHKAILIARASTRTNFEATNVVRDLDSLNVVRPIPTIVRTQGTVRPLSCAIPGRCQPQARAVGFEAKRRTGNRKKREEISTSMTDEHIRALDGIGFDWGTNKTDLESIWNVRFQ